MKTIQGASSVLRRIAIAGLGVASLWTASQAHAAIGCARFATAANFLVAPESSRIAGGGCRGACMSRLPPAEFDESPPAFGCKPYAGPLHASQSCRAEHRGPAEHATAEHPPLRVAGGEPPIVVDSRRGPQPRG